MKYLFIGGTGNISMYITKELLRTGHEVWLINRGNRNDGLSGNVHYITADINREEEKVRDAIEDMYFDAVADFIVFTREQAERDVRLFRGKCNQYLVFSSASVYQKPLSNYRITESTPISNPFWLYSRNKIMMEEYLNEEYRESGFPVTIVRPSHTYGDRYIPLATEGRGGGWAVVKRIMEGKPVIVHGDGLSLWTVTHSADFAKGFIGLLGNIHAIGETFHITSDESVTWNQIYETIGRTVGKKPVLYHVSSEWLAEVSPYGFTGGLLGDKACSVVFDNTKLKTAVPDFVCRIRMDQGVADTVRNFLADPALQREDPEYDAWTDRTIAALEETKEKLKAAMTQN